MADWKIAGTYVEFCNCDPGCACNFRGSPNSAEGNCQAVITHSIDEGNFDSVDLAGATCSWALWWPGAIHERGGRGYAYVDCGSDEQYAALERIWRGEEGYSLFEIFNSTLDEVTAVDRSTIDLKIDGKRTTVAIDGVTDNVMTPLTNPVSGEENQVRILKPGGFIWEDGEIAQSERFKVDLPGMTWNISERHAVFSRFEYSNAA